MHEIQTFCPVKTMIKGKPTTNGVTNRVTKVQKGIAPGTVLLAGRKKKTDYCTVKCIVLYVRHNTETREEENYPQYLHKNCPGLW